jgi:hypothetical protein
MRQSNLGITTTPAISRSTITLPIGALWGNGKLGLYPSQTWSSACVHQPITLFPANERALEILTIDGGSIWSSGLERRFPVGVVPRSSGGIPLNDEAGFGLASP